jgi:hypothetical protein
MRSKKQIYDMDIITNHRIKTDIIPSIKNESFTRNKRVIDILCSEGGGDFVNYIEWLGLSKDPNLMVLSSMHHYYYDSEEMKNIKSLINLKEFNQIKDIKVFLHSIFRIIPLKSYFIGCYVDNNKKNGFEVSEGHSSIKSKMTSEAVENGISSRNPFLNMIYDLIDSRTNNYLSKAGITQLLEDCGFKVLDITEINGISYFCAQKHKLTGN